MVAAAPSAAASVGVAKPPVIAPTTIAKISTSGSTWTRNGRQRSQKPCAGGSSSFGARLGSIMARVMM